MNIDDISTVNELDEFSVPVESDSIVAKKDAFIRSIESGSERFFHGLAEPFMGLGQMVNKLESAVTGGASEAVQRGMTGGTYEEWMQRKQAEKPTTEGWDIAGTVGNIVGTLPLAGITGPAGGAVGGVAVPVEDDEDYWRTKLLQGGIGAILGKVLSPQLTPKRGVDELMAEGISPTVGQAFGRGVEAIEQKATSIPFVGDMIANARRRGIEDLNEAALRKAHEAGGVPKKHIPAGKIGNEGVELALNKTDALYKIGFADLPYKATKAFDYDAVMQGEEVTDALRGMSKDMEKEFKRNVTRALRPFDDVKPSEFGQVYKMIDSDLGTAANDYMTSGNARDRQIGRAIKAYQNEGRRRAVELAEGQGGPQQIRAADAMRERLYPIEKASERAAAREGVYTPYQLLAAVRGKKGAGARELRTLARRGQHVLGSQYPDSGTAGRIFQGALLSGGPIGAATGLVSPGGGAAMVGGALAYTPAMQKQIIALMRKGVPLVDAVRQVTGGVAGGNIGAAQ